RPGAAPRSAPRWGRGPRACRRAAGCRGSRPGQRRHGARCPRPSPSSPGHRPARRTCAASARQRPAAARDRWADGHARPGLTGPARPAPPRGARPRRSPSGSASAPPRPCHRVHPASGHRSWPPPAVRGAPSVPTASGRMPRVGHNVGVTDAPTPPSRPARARAFFARAVDDAQFARPKLALTSLGLLCVMVLGGSLLPVPYVIERPGPALDVLGEYQDEQILTIEDAETYPTEGELMMTTVSVDGGPGYRVTPVEVITSCFDRSKQVLPKEAVFPEGQTREQTDLDNSAAMSGSQQGAVAVALDELGIEYEDVVQVAGVEKDGPA